MNDLHQILNPKSITERSKATLRRSFPRMNQLALIHDLKLSNAKHFKLLRKLITEKNIESTFEEVEDQKEIKGQGVCPPG